MHLLRIRSHADQKVTPASDLPRRSSRRTSALAELVHLGGKDIESRDAILRVRKEVGGHAEAHSP